MCGFMFTIFARHKGNGSHTEAHADTLDDALCHLNEIITSELEDAEGPLYWTYGIEFDPKLAKTARPLSYHHPNLKPKPRSYGSQRHSTMPALTAALKKREKRLAGKGAG